MALRRHSLRGRKICSNCFCSINTSLDNTDKSSAIKYYNTVVESLSVTRWSARADATKAFRQWCRSIAAYMLHLKNCNTTQNNRLLHGPKMCLLEPLWWPSFGTQSYNDFKLPVKHFKATTMTLEQSSICMIHWQISWLQYGLMWNSAKWKMKPNNYLIAIRIQSSRKSTAEICKVISRRPIWKWQYWKSKPKWKVQSANCIFCNFGHTSKWAEKKKKSSLRRLLPEVWGLLKIWWNVQTRHNQLSKQTYWLLSRNWYWIPWWIDSLFSFLVYTQYAMQLLRANHLSSRLLIQMWTLH